MHGAVIHAPGDVRYEERPDPTILEPTDALVRTVAACVCGSDLWRYRGISPVSQPTPRGVTRVDVVSALDMHAAVMARIAAQDVFVGVAAVADYRPQLTADHKLKKDEGDLPPIALIRNPDILADVAALPKPPLCVGFAAESRDLAAYAEKKRKSKKIPLIVGNLIQDGFGGDDNRLVLFDAHGETPLPPGSKLELSRRLVAHIALMLEKH